jgi:hypothetical protein
LRASWPLVVARYAAKTSLIQELHREARPVLARLSKGNSFKGLTWWQREQDFRSIRFLSVMRCHDYTLIT